MNKNLVSVIIPTKNSSNTIAACLKSIKNQTYKRIEIIVVDNNSEDSTKLISRKFTKKVFNQGPERSSQRNFGAKKAKGEYILFLDSDMTLDKKVVKEGVDIFANSSKTGGLIIPEKSVGISFWGKCKALEKTFYERVSWIEASRFYRKRIFDQMKGFDSELISGEDWDLSKRVEEKSEIKRTKSFVIHHEGEISLLSTLQKKYYYSIHIPKYINKNGGKLNIMVWDRYRLFFSNPKKLFKNPLLGIGLLFMKTSEFAAGAVGYLVGGIRDEK